MADDEADEVTMTTLGVRIPEDVRAKIREAAKLEERTESSFARYYLNRAAELVLGETAQREG
jgi:uncharacterized protein (DUF1778 family)